MQSAAGGFRLLPLEKVAEACIQDDNIELVRSVVAASDAVAAPIDNNTVHQINGTHIMLHFFDTK